MAFAVNNPVTIKRDYDVIHGTIKQKVMKNGSLHYVIKTPHNGELTLPHHKLNYVWR